MSKSWEHAITVELQPHELPPKPNPVRRALEGLRDVAMVADELGDEVIAKLEDLRAAIQRRKAAA